jgi:hypothetical protein
MSPPWKGFAGRAKNVFGRMLGRNRRQFQRFVGRAITPVFIGKGAPQEASLIDISIGGVALDYKAGAAPVKKVFAMDLHAKDGFRLGKVLMEKVSDKTVKIEGEPFTHRLRAKFLNLSQAKANKLGKFLEIYQEQVKA